MYEEAQRSLGILISEIVTILERFSAPLMDLISFTDFETSSTPHGHVSLNKNRIKLNKNRIKAYIIIKLDNFTS